MPPIRSGGYSSFNLDHFLARCAEIFETEGLLKVSTESTKPKFWVHLNFRGLNGQCAISWTMIQ